MESRTEFRKIKLSKGRVKLEWDVYPEGTDTPDHYSLDSIEQPKDSFPAAMLALAEHLVMICELPANYVDRVTVIGVSLSWTDGVMGATITGLMSLYHSSAPLVLNTPHKPEAPYSEGADESNLLPEETVAAIYELIAAAGEYVAGERKVKQMDLFAAPEPEAVAV